MGFGATIFEKHITLDKNTSGPDHGASSDIPEFKKYVSDLKSGFLALGHENKKTIDAEKSMKFTSQKSLVYKKNMKPEDVIRKEDLSAMRPLDGIPIFRFEEFIGKILTKSVLKNQNLSEDHFE